MAGRIIIKRIRRGANEKKIQDKTQKDKTQKHKEWRRKQTSKLIRSQCWNTGEGRVCMSLSTVNVLVFFFFDDWIKIYVYSNWSFFYYYYIFAICDFLKYICVSSLSKINRSIGIWDMKVHVITTSNIQTPPEKVICKEITSYWKLAVIGSHCKGKKTNM